jgi:hypothetical protein
MTLFNFRSIQELEISESDNPKIDVQDGRLVLTAERNKEKIVITAPLNGIVASAVATTLKAPKRRIKGNPTGVNLHVGIDNGMAKLDDTSVREIRTLLADTSFTKNYTSVTSMYKDLGKAYQVSGWAIKNVADNISWKHVTI